MTFYDALIAECGKETLVYDDHVTDNQKYSFKEYGKYLDEIGEDNYVKVASEIVIILHNYNHRISLEELKVIKCNNNENPKKADISTIERFIKVLNDSRKITRKEYAEDPYKELMNQVEFYLEDLKNDEILYIKRLRSSKTPLIEKLKEIAKRYNIPNSQKELVVNLDEWRPY